MTTMRVSLPDLGQGVSSGEFVAWLVDVGDHVDAEQAIAEVETEKSVVEVPAPAAGEITELRVEVGTEVTEGDVIAVLDAEEGSEIEKESDSTSDKPNAEEATAEASTTSDQHEDIKIATGRVFAPPRIRRLARELGVDISLLRDGSRHITEADVRAAAETTGSGSETDDEGGFDDDVEEFKDEERFDDERERSRDEKSSSGPREMTGGQSVTKRRTTDEGEDGKSTPTPRETPGGKSVIRRREEQADPDEQTEFRRRDEQMVEAEPAEQARPETGSGRVDPPSTADDEQQTVRTESTAIQYDEVDVTAMRAAHDRLVAADVADGTVTELTFVVAAVAAALRETPELNGPLRDGEIDRQDDINVAVAVPTDDGLVSPVVVDADDVGLPVLARELAELVERAEEGELTAPETADGTFTVAEFGALGGTYAIPNLEEFGTSLLALGDVRERPRVRDGEASPRAVVPLSAAVDARALDSGTATQFRETVRRYLETPELLLLDQ